MRRPLLATAPFLALAPLADAQLDLVVEDVIDISGLGFHSLGGADFDAATGHLWLSDAASYVNEVVEFDVDLRVVVSSFDASVVPGIAGGPDALAVDPVSGELVLYAVFGSDDAAGVVTQAGGLVASYAPADDVTGLAFDASGALRAVADAAGVLYDLDPDDGSVLGFVPLSQFVGRLTALTYDPRTSNLFAITDDTDSLVEIDPANGDVLSTTDLVSLMGSSGFPGGCAFSPDGRHLYVSKGSGQGAGQLWVLRREGALGTSYCGPAVPNSSGGSAVISASGSDAVVANDLTLHASVLPTSSFGYFLNSLDQGFQANPGGSQGNVCLAGAIGRHARDVLHSGTAGEVELAIDLTSLPQPGGAVVVVAGDTWNFQYWFRDANPTVTSNFSDGLELTFR